jgi:Ala-tRNA(Pro) deacylase
MRNTLDHTPPAAPDAAVHEALDALGIGYTRHDHPPVYTVAEAEAHWRAIDATHCKNLFLRNQTGTRHYLVVAERHATVDIKRLATLLGDDRLSFASAERLAKYLGLTAGSVSPFGLINDRAHHVQVAVDVTLRDAARVAFHPNVNTATVVLSSADFLRFLTSTGHLVRWVHLAPTGA